MKTTVGRRRIWASLVAAVLISTCWAGCGSYKIGCNPASDLWQINVNQSPMVVVDNTPQIHVGEKLPMAVFTLDGVLCPDGDPGVVAWEVGDAGVGAITPNQPLANEATLLGIAPGETAITARITFPDGTTTRTSSLWAAVSSSRDVVRVVP